MSEENEQQQQPSQRERLDRQQPDSPHLHSHEKPIHHIRTSKTGGCDPLGTSGSHVIAGNPVDRMNRCGWNTSQRLGRPATEDEIWDAYHAEGLNTGEDEDGNRQKLAQQSAQWLAVHYDPTKRETFDPENYVPLLQTYVTEAITETIRQKNRSQYNDFDLAVVLHVIERSATTRHPKAVLQYTVPNNSLSAMFARLGTPMKGTEAAIRNRLAAIKQVLVAAGLAEIVNPNWWQGVGKKYGLGPNHPQRTQYLLLTESR
jgi:hypothetical protein